MSGVALYACLGQSFSPRLWPSRTSLSAQLLAEMRSVGGSLGKHSSFPCRDTCSRSGTSAGIITGLCLTCALRDAPHTCQVQWLFCETGTRLTSCEAYGENQLLISLASFIFSVGVLLGWRGFVNEKMISTKIGQWHGSKIRRWSLTQSVLK